MTFTETVPEELLFPPTLLSSGASPNPNPNPLAEGSNVTRSFDPTGDKALTNPMNSEFSHLAVNFDLSSNPESEFRETSVPGERSRSSSPATSSSDSAKPKAKRRKPPVVILSSNVQLAAEVNLLDSLTAEGSDNPLPPKVFADEQTYLKYIKRRQNNNVAATKSRLKKKQVEQANMERSKILESENENLRQELQKLQVETKYLKEVLQNILSNQGPKS